MLSVKRAQKPSPDAPEAKVRRKAKSSALALSIGDWVTVKPASRKSVDKIKAQTPCLVTLLDGDRAHVLYPNVLSIFINKTDREAAVRMKTEKCSVKDLCRYGEKDGEEVRRLDRMMRNKLLSALGKKREDSSAPEFGSVAVDDQPPPVAGADAADEAAAPDEDPVAELPSTAVEDIGPAIITSEIGDVAVADTAQAIEEPVSGAASEPLANSPSRMSKAAAAPAGLSPQKTVQKSPKDAKAWLTAFTTAVGKEFKAARRDVLDTKGLEASLASQFSDAEVKQGLAALEKVNKIMLADAAVFLI